MVSRMAISFDTHPDRYKHWTLKIEGATSADSTSLRRSLLWLGKKPMPEWTGD